MDKDIEIIDQVIQEAAKSLGLIARRVGDEPPRWTRQDAEEALADRVAFVRSFPGVLSCQGQLDTWDDETQHGTGQMWFVKRPNLQNVTITVRTNGEDIQA